MCQHEEPDTQQHLPSRVSNKVGRDQPALLASPEHFYSTEGKFTHFRQYLTERIV